MAGFLRIFTKRIAISWEERKHHSPEERGGRGAGKERAGSQHLGSYRVLVAGVLLQWWTAQHTDPSLPRSLSPFLIAQRLIRTCIACSHLQLLNAEMHSLNLMAAAPLLPDLTFTTCRHCYKESICSHAVDFTSQRALQGNFICGSPIWVGAET